MKKKKKAAKQISKKKKAKQAIEHKKGEVPLKALTLADMKTLKRKLKEVIKQERDSIRIFNHITGFHMEMCRETEVWKYILKAEIDKSNNRNSDTMDEPYATLGSRAIEFESAQETFFASYVASLKVIQKTKNRIKRRMQHHDENKITYTVVYEMKEMMETYASTISVADFYKEGYEKLKELFNKLKKDFSKLKPN